MLSPIAIGGLVAGGVGVVSLAAAIRFILNLRRVVPANETKDVSIAQVEGQKARDIIDAAGIQAEGGGRAEAEKAWQMATISALIELAREIVTYAGYQQYLVTVKQIEATRDVGMEHAQALKQADVKVISNVDTPVGESLIDKIAKIPVSPKATQKDEVVTPFIEPDAQIAATPVEPPTSEVSAFLAGFEKAGGKPKTTRVKKKSKMGGSNSLPS